MQEPDVSMASEEPQTKGWGSPLDATSLHEGLTALPTTEEVLHTVRTP